MLISNVNIKSGIANKGFRGMRSVLARFKVHCNLIGDTPAILYWTYRQPSACAKTPLDCL
jgi:hypothetical protein